MPEQILMPDGESIELPDGTDYILMPSGESILEAVAAGGGNIKPKSALHGSFIFALGGPI